MQKQQKTRKERKKKERKRERRRRRRRNGDALADPVAPDLGRRATQVAAQPTQVATRDCVLSVSGFFFFFLSFISDEHIFSGIAVAIVVVGFFGFFFAVVFVVFFAVVVVVMFLDVNRVLETRFSCRCHVEKNATLDVNNL